MKMIFTTTLLSFFRRNNLGCLVIHSLAHPTNDGHKNPMFRLGTHSALLEFSEIGFLGETYNEYVSEEEKFLAVNWIDEEDLDSIDWIGTGETNKEKYFKINAIAQANFYLNYWAFEHLMT